MLSPVTLEALPWVRRRPTSCYARDTMRPIKTYSPVVFAASTGLGAVAFIGLMMVAWTSDTAEVGLAMSAKLQISLAALVLGGGLAGWGFRYRANAIQEADEREMVRRSLRG